MRGKSTAMARFTFFLTTVEMLSSCFVAQKKQKIRSLLVSLWNVFYRVDPRKMVVLCPEGGFKCLGGCKDDGVGHGQFMPQTELACSQRELRVKVHNESLLHSGHSLNRYSYAILFALERGVDPFEEALQFGDVPIRDEFNAVFVFVHLHFLTGQ